MKGGKKKPRSINLRVSNRSRERSLSRDDAFIVYVMDRVLYRPGQQPAIAG